MLSCAITVVGQDTIIPLWPKDIPSNIITNEKEVHKKGEILRISKVQIPTIEVYLPAKEKATGQAVLIFPGGGYHLLAYDWEGTDIAKLLNDKGIAGIVVKYRLPESKSLVDKHKIPLQDAQRAIRIVRSKTKEWGIHKGKIGIIGFSAGGHLAATLGTHFKEEVYSKQDAIDTFSARPDFMALVYPVITMKKQFTHQGSKEALLGEDATAKLVRHYSNELHVSSKTPPTFLMHATDDRAVPVENSLLFFSSLKQFSVPVTMHIYPEGGHGFSLALKNKHLKNWVKQWYVWLENL